MHHEGGCELRKGGWVDAGYEGERGGGFGCGRWGGVYAYGVEFVETHPDDASEEEEEERRMADLDVEGSPKWTAGEVESVVEVWRFQCDFFVSRGLLGLACSYHVAVRSLCVCSFFACPLGGLSSLYLCVSYNIFVRTTSTNKITCRQRCRCSEPMPKYYK
jgi:hypothetical protein